MSGKNFKISARLNSFKHAFAGIAEAVKSEHNAWIHAAATVIVIIAGFVFKLSKVEWCIIILCIGMVWTAEIFNSAIERLTDLASPKRHSLAKKAKDAAAGAVLVTAITATIIGLIIFLPRIFR